MKHLEFKPDFQKTIDRFEAWWHGVVLDRPPVSLYVRPQKTPRPLPKIPTTLREKWMDVEYNVEAAVADMEARPWMGDAMPVFFPNVGPDLTATIFGCDLLFAEDTSYAIHPVSRPDEWEKFLTLPLNFNNPYWQAIESMMKLAIEQSQGRYLVGMPDLHGSLDILVELRSPGGLCTDLVDCPEIIQKMSLRGVEAMNSAFERSFALVNAAGMGSTTWSRFYHEGPAYVSSCDFLALISPHMGKKFVLPTLLAETEALSRSHYHLDGPSCLPHLEWIMTIDKIQSIQWVYGAGKGPADLWIETYRSILSRGKSVELISETPQDALNVLKAVGPKGVWMNVGGEFATPEEADNFLHEVEIISRTTPSVHP